MKQEKNLNGVLLEEGMDGVNYLLRMVATDGHRLAWQKAVHPDLF